MVEETPNNQLHDQLRELHARISDGSSLRLFDDATGNMRAIARLCSEAITRIVLMGDGWQDRDIEQLQRFPNLRELKISGGERLTDESLVHISKLPTLSDLDLKGVTSDHMTKRGFGQLSRLSDVRLIRFPSLWGGSTLGEAAEAKAEVKAMLQRALPNAVIQ